jgi:hypothetical protein
MVMEKLKKVKELIIETVESFNTDFEYLNLDLTEFIETVNKTDNLDELDDYVTDYLYSENILEKEYEVSDFWKYVYKSTAELI